MAETLKDILIEAKTEQDALLAFANSTTGSEDVRLGDAIKKLCDGYGGGGAYFKYSGTNPRLIAEHHEEYTLADTSFVIGQTAPTASTTIRASEAQKVSIPVDLSTMDVVLVETLTVTPTYSDYATDIGRQTKYVTRRASLISNVDLSTTDNTGSNSSAVSFTITLNTFYSAKNKYTKAVQAGYGMNGSLPTGPSLSSSARPDTIVRLGSPNLLCRADSNQLTESNMRCITECTWAWDVEAYRVDKDTSLFGITRSEILDILK